MVLNIVKKLVERYTDGNITAVITKANFSTDVFFHSSKNLGTYTFWNNSTWLLLNIAVQ